MIERELETGFLAVPAAMEEVALWVAEGPVAAHVVEAPSRWTLVVPETRTSLPPVLDHPAALVAGRPLPESMRPAIGLFLVGPRGVVTLQGRSRWSGTRWCCWSPGRGAERLPRLSRLTPGLLAAGAPAAPKDARARLEHAFATMDGTAERFLRRVVQALEIPGEQLVGDPGAARGMAGSHLVRPTPDAIRVFTDAATPHTQVLAEREAEENL